MAYFSDNQCFMKNGCRVARIYGGVVLPFAVLVVGDISLYICNVNGKEKHKTKKNTETKFGLKI